MEFHGQPVQINQKWVDRTGLFLLKNEPGSIILNTLKLAGKIIPYSYKIEFIPSSLDVTKV